ncbi:hypothetical protein AAULR_23434 [Lacticaseibacillus rhamnosus MTCC 5462]|nr:hypothetical protein AAULR_23434 [Lacticaseibacillus rhamnosus MTCC 5462]
MSGASNDWAVERWRAIAGFDKVDRDNQDGKKTAKLVYFLI